MSTEGPLRVIHRPPLAGGPDAGEVVVLVHGAMDRATSFTRLMARLPDRSLVAYDRRGYGRSHHKGPPTSFDQQVDDLLEVLGDTPTIAFGHSFGGDIVLAAACRRPETVAAAFVWEPPQPWLPWWQNRPAADDDVELEAAEHAELFMRRMVGDRIWDRLPSKTKADRRAEGATLQAELDSLSIGPVFDPARIRIPVIVGRGGRSPTYVRRAARELASSLPQGRLADIAEAGHGAHLTHPAELAALVRKTGSLRPQPKPENTPGPANY